jgi:hypothetical protein
VDTGGELVRAPEDGGREVEAEPDLLIVAPVALGELLEERKLDRGVLGRGGGWRQWRGLPWWQWAC